MRSLSTRSLRTLAPSAQKQRQKNYDFHIKKVLEIQSAQSQKKIVATQSKIAQNLRKSKQMSKKFIVQEAKSKRKEQDKKLIKTLMQIDKKPIIKSQMTKKPRQIKLQTLPSRTISKQKLYHQQRISTQNVRLARNIMSSATQVKQYKKKMRTEIDQYIKLRTHIQKFKPMELRSVVEKRPSKTSEELLALIKLKSDQIKKHQSNVNISVPEDCKQNDIREKEQELLL